MTEKKKGHQKFSAKKWTVFSKKRSFKNLVREGLFRPPKLGTKSPPMMVTLGVLTVYSIQNADDIVNVPKV